MWHKAEWMGHPMRLKLTLLGLLVKLANHYTIQGTQVHVVYGTMAFWRVLNICDRAII